MLLRLKVLLEQRLQEARERPDAGYTTETVIMWAIIITAALAVGAILTAKLLEAAGKINFG